MATFFPAWAMRAIAFLAPSNWAWSIATQAFKKRVKNMSISIDHDLERLAYQEQALQLDTFNETTAWTLGTRIKALCEERKVAVTIEIRRAGQTLFFHAMSGTTPNNAEWVRRKRNAVELFNRSSYALGLAYAKEGTTPDQKQGLATLDYAIHGGGFPIRVKSVGCIGCVTVSGVPQREDHAIVVEALAELCQVPLASVALDPL